MGNLTVLAGGHRVTGMMSEGMIDTGTDRRWCILRTAGPRTLVLARSLSDGGLDVWTPTEVIKRRRSRSRAIVEFAVPIMPTFVFANAVHLADLLTMRTVTGSQHPAFSVFRAACGVPIIADREIHALRLIEQRARERAMRAKGKQARTSFAPGERVRVANSEAAWSGMVGVVEASEGKEASVHFGGKRAVKIATYLLVSEVIQAGQPEQFGTAALAA